ncbi:protein ROH1D-like [Rutidosis leptorrhynchoides]|uniref:protein ROH1D-like n=1 Tax=Rutidosis leptorrhynchoides TaxID=125765 RepID=UPI003A9A46E5
MPSTSSSSKSFGAFRSALGFGADQNRVHFEDVNSNPKSQLNRELERFQELVSSQFHVLSDSSTDEFLSIEWMSKLLDAFITCQDDFKLILLNNADAFSKPPLDKQVTEFFDRSIKALDICNAVRDGIEKVRLWRKHLEIVSIAFDSKQRNVMSEGQFRRARKSLTDLAIVMLDDHKETGSIFSNRNRSFGRPNKGKDSNHQRKQGHAKSLSWSVSNSWSASKQLQSMANSLVPPRMGEISQHNGLANCVFTMGFVLMFVLWTVVAAIPCQDRGLFNFSVPKQFSWSNALWLLHTRVMDESKKRERKNSPGLLKEIYMMEKSINLMSDLIDSAQQFPLTEEQQKEVKDGVHELNLVCSSCKNGLDTLDRQLREVFRKIMHCRTEGLGTLSVAQS